MLNVEESVKKLEFIADEMENDVNTEENSLVNFYWSEICN